MKFVKPTPITDAKLISSSVAENDHAAWSDATTYAQGNKVILTSTHRIYESVQGGNLNKPPASDDGTWWIDIGPTNRWAMFDSAVGTVTTAAEEITVTLAPGIASSLALLDLDGTEVRATMIDGPGGPTVYDRTITLGDSAIVVDWAGYFFDDIIPRTVAFFDDIPPYSAGRITITVSAVTTAGCGTLAIGRTIDIGKTRMGARVGIVDYSKKETDIFGVTDILERSYAKRIEAEVYVENTRLDYVTRQLSDVRATPCVWLADNGAGYESLVAYGFYKDWGVNISYPNHSECSLTIEGLT